MNKVRNIIETTLVSHTAFEEAVRRIDQCFTNADGSAEPICIALVGESRTGKSRVLEECLLKHPITRSKEGLEVPILMVKIPSKPTVKGLVELMLYTIGDPKFNVGTENMKTIRLRTLILETGTQMVIFDEFQHFYDKVSHKVQHYVADWMKVLVDDCKVALVVSGLPACQAVLEQNEQLVGRFLAPLFMPRFDWRDEGHRAEYTAIIGAFYESLAHAFDLPELDKPDMDFRCYCGTGGLIGYLTKFLRQLVWNASDKGTKVITFEDLLIAHKQAVWTKSCSLSLPSPFSREFSTIPSTKLLDDILQIGTAVKPTVKARKAVKKAGRRPSSQSVLSSK